MSDTAFVTAHAAHKLVNQRLEEAGLSKRIPPQMMYNYTTGRIREGKVPFIAYTEEAGVDLQSLEEWTTKYVRKQIVTARVNAELDAE